VGRLRARPDIACRDAVASARERDQAPLTYPDKPFNDISNDIIKGMSTEIFSVQSVTDKIRNLQPTIDQLFFIWRAIIIGFVVGIVVSYLALSIPVYSKVGQDIVGWIWPPRPATFPHLNHLPRQVRPFLSDTVGLKVDVAEEIDCLHPKVPERNNQAGVISTVTARPCAGK
jgi:hypothetical protein